MVEVSFPVLLSGIEDKIENRMEGNNFIWNIVVFHIFPNWSVFLVLVLVKVILMRTRVDRAKSITWELPWVLDSAKVHKYQSLWYCENGVDTCVQKDFFWWKLYFRIDSCSPIWVSVEGVHWALEGLISSMFPDSADWN